MNKKAILILGGSNDQLFMIETAQKMGLITVVVDGNKNAPGLNIADYSQAIDFSNIPLVVKYVEKLISMGVNVSGVITMGSDVPHIVAKIANYFSWYSQDEKIANITTNKFLMKKFFQANNISVPNFSLVNSVDDIKDKLEKWKCNYIIIKPIDAAGSRGVSICDNTNDIGKLFNYAKKNSKSGKVIIEEYIEGDQISTETVVYNNEFYHPGFADRVYSDTKNFYPYIIENGGWQPSKINKKKHDEICNLIENIAKVLNFKNGIIKGDIVYSNKYNKPMVIEVASRLSGGDFSASLVPLSYGINYVKTAIQIALNEKVDLNELNPKCNYIVANRYFFVPQGKLISINGVDEIKKINNIKKIEFNYNINSIIPKIENHSQRVGVFVVQGETYEQVQEIIDEVYKKVTFTVNGKIYSGHPKYYEI